VNSSTSNLVLAPDAGIDLQMHTTYSDGKWTPEDLVDHLVSEGFGMVGITDHERVDTYEALQKLAAEKGLPIVAAAEFSTAWNNGATDVLCFGFDPAKPALGEMAKKLHKQQQEIMRGVYENLQKDGKTLPDEGAGMLDMILELPPAQQGPRLRDLLIKHGYATGIRAAWEVLFKAGFLYAKENIEVVVEAAHESGAVCLIAHPGRGGDYMRYTTTLLDQVRRDAPIDGMEAYYPAHSQEQTAMFVAYARQHNLLTSSGSDSHGPQQKPIKYRAELSRALLERVGVRVEG
jgi:predicted metal-dependent phosphoesterase TrpH